MKRSPPTVRNRVAVAVVAACAGLPGAGLRAAPLVSKDALQGGAVTERSIYINRRPVGVFPVCTKADSAQVYLPADFYRLVMLKRSDETIDCEGTAFTRPRLDFERDDGRLLLSASATPEDYAEGGESDDAHDAPPPPSKPVPSKRTTASVLEHSLGLWASTASRSANLSASLQASHYNELGRFEANGSFSVDAGRFRGSVADLSFHRHVDALQADLAIGSRTIRAAQQGLSLRGVMLESDDSAPGAPLNVERVLEGFADTPGKLSIRSGGVLLREIQVSAGRFSIPVSSLGTARNNSGDYTMTLQDASGAVVRSWSAFVPYQNSLLRAGDATWKAFAGQLDRTGERALRASSDRWSPGVGAVYQRGLNAKTTVEGLAVLEQGGGRLGVSLYHVPASWMSVSAAVGKVWRRDGGHRPMSFHLEADFHGQSLGANFGVSSRSCESEFLFARRPDACRSAWARLRMSLDSLGTVGLFAEQSSGRSASQGISWDLPNFGRSTASLYANRTTTSQYGRKNNYSVGLTLTVPLTQGSIRSALRHDGSGNTTASTTYAGQQGPDLSYSLGAQVQARAGSGDRTTQLSGTLQYTPWHGVYGANFQLDKNGGFLGLTESGALVWTEGQLLRGKAGGDDSLAVIHAPQARGVTLERGGQPQAVMNGDGYAAVFAARGDNKDFKLSAGELGEDIRVGTDIVGQVDRRWAATLWQPEVRKVNRGWMQLALESGAAVPAGSLVQIAGADPGIVLDDGEVFIEEFPPGTSQAQVLLPGNAARCSVKFDAPLELKSSNLAMPRFVCNQPSRN